MKYKQIWKTAAACLMAAVMLPGCSDEEGGGTTPTGDGLATLVVSLQAENSSEPVGTRAEDSDFEDLDEEPDDAYERKIENWWVVIFNGEGQYEDYLSNTKEGTSYDGPTGERSDITTSIKLPIGTYSLYAFANLRSLANGQEIINEIKNGSITKAELVANREDKTVGLQTSITDLLKNYNKPVNERPWIPMSSFVKTFELDENTAGQGVELPLYRMIGKVRIIVDNQMGQDISINSLSMGKFRTAGSMFLMPYDGLETIGDNIEMTKTMQPIFPENPTVSEGKGDYNYLLTDEEKSITEGNKKTYVFYVPETPIETQESGSSMTITIDIPEKGGSSTKSTSFDFIRRNDLLEIPLNVSNIETKIRYKTLTMPIGALGKEVVYGNPDGIAIMTDAVFTVEPDYTGPVEIEYEIESIANQTTGLQIKYLEEGGTIEGSEGFSNAVVTENKKGTNDYGLLIGSNGQSLENNTVIGIAPVVEDGIASPTKGSFIVNTQELQGDDDATIVLTLVVTYTKDGVSQDITIPYTIRVQNYSSTTTN